MDFPAEQEFSLIYIAYASGVISDVFFFNEEYVSTMFLLYVFYKDL